MSIAVLITRPEPSALHLADTLRARWGCGVRIVISPVLEIASTGATLDLSEVKTLIFTSQHGVAAYLDAADRRDLPCYAVGAATAKAAQEAGLTTVHADGDVEALLTLLLNAPATPPCLHIRGAHVTGNLAQRLTDQGLQTSEAVLYDQVERPLNDEALGCISRVTPTILPLYSPRSAEILFSQIQPSRRLFVAAMSANVAANVPIDDVNSVLVPDQPTSDGMLQVLDDLLEQAKRVEGAKRAQ
jgi:uroporphyrinogen-III synthase